MSTSLLPEHANALATFDHVQRTRLVFGNGMAARTGELSAELQAMLGMRAGEPPPYLPRMQQLGYPPEHADAAVYALAESCSSSRRCRGFLEPGM